MCGIIGYIGNRPCVETLFNGLKTLEYRGYDSAGITVQRGNELFLIKAAGKLTNLEPLLAELPQDTVVGMGHTYCTLDGSVIDARRVSVAASTSTSQWVS